MSGRLSTPPPASEMPAMPQTPRWGYGDNYEPYPATRAAACQRANGTQVPTTPRKVASGTQGSKLVKPVYTGTAFSGGSSYTPPSTVAKKRTCKVSDLDDDLDLARDGSRSPIGFQSSSAMKTGMPSTPERTPRQKKGLPKSDSNSSLGSLGSISRNLFSSRLDDDAMPTPRKHVKYGDVLGEVEEEEIHIFTDSKERIPEVDVSFKNPFYGPGRRISAAKVAQAPSKGRKGKTDAAAEEEEEHSRSDGYWAVFRGKKIFRKYDEMEHADEDVRAGANMDDDFAAELDATVPERLRGPITRSRDLKPRILFPTAAQVAAKKQKEKQQQQQQASNTDEEADTDIEDAHVAAPIPKPKVVEKGLKTPRTLKVTAPLSPPTTARTTRSKDVHSDDIASASFTSTGSHSQEFQSWQSAKPQSKKRHAASDVDAGSHKRIRSHVA